MKNSRKIIFGLFLVVGLVFLAAPMLVFAQQNPGSEQLTITTYYPSPYGVYKQLRMYPYNGPNATPPDAPPSCTADNIGLIYYDGSTSPGQLMICGGAGPAIPIGGGSWALKGGDLFSTNPGSVFVGGYKDTSGNAVGTGNLFVQSGLGISETLLRPTSSGFYSLDINNPTASLALGPLVPISEDQTVSKAPVVSIDSSNSANNPANILWNPLATFNGALRVAGSDDNNVLGGIELGNLDTRAYKNLPAGHTARWLLQAYDGVTFKGRVTENNYSVSSNAWDARHGDYSSWVEVTSNDRPLAGTSYKSKGIASVNFNNGNIQVKAMPPIVVVPGQFFINANGGQPGKTGLSGVPFLTDTRGGTYSGTDFTPEDPGYFCYVIRASLPDASVAFYGNNGTMSSPGVWKFFGTFDATTIILCVRDELLGMPDPTTLVPGPNASALITP